MSRFSLANKLQPAKKAWKSITTSVQKTKLISKICKNIKTTKNRCISAIHTINSFIAHKLYVLTRRFKRRCRYHLYHHHHCHHLQTSRATVYIDELFPTPPSTAAAKETFASSSGVGAAKFEIMKSPDIMEKKQQFENLASTGVKILDRKTEVKIHKTGDQTSISVSEGKFKLPMKSNLTVGKILDQKTGFKILDHKTGDQTSISVSEGKFKLPMKLNSTGVKILDHKTGDQTSTSVAEGKFKFPMKVNSTGIEILDKKTGDQTSNSVAEGKFKLPMKVNSTGIEIQKTGNQTGNSVAEGKFNLPMKVNSTGIEIVDKKTGEKIVDQKTGDQSSKSVAEDKLKLPMKSIFRGIDERAEEFISKFKEEMKLEREKSIIDFQEMLARST